MADCTVLFYLEMQSVSTLVILFKDRVLMRNYCPAEILSGRTVDVVTAGNVADFNAIARDIRECLVSLDVESPKVKAYFDRWNASQLALEFEKQMPKAEIIMARRLHLPKAMCSRVEQAKQLRADWIAGWNKPERVTNEDAEKLISQVIARFERVNTGITEIVHALPHHLRGKAEKGMAAGFWFEVGRLFAEDLD